MMEKFTSLASFVDVRTVVNLGLVWGAAAAKLQKSPNKKEASENNVSTVAACEITGYRSFHLTPV